MPDNIEKYRNEYFQLINLAIDILENHEFQTKEWLGFTKTFLFKIIGHNISIFNCIYNNSFQLSNNKKFHLNDYPTSVILIRGCLESYLAFHHIYVYPISIDEKKLRFLLWQLCNYNDRQDSLTWSDAAIEKRKEEEKEVNHMIEDIKSNLYYEKLDNRDLKSYKREKWRLKLSWAKLAENAGFKESFIKRAYSYLSDYAHTGNLAIRQLRYAKNEDSIYLINANLGNGLIILSSFIHDYCNLHQPLSNILLQNNEDIKTVKMWYSIGKSLSF